MSNPRQNAWIRDQMARGLRASQNAVPRSILSGDDLYIPVTTTPEGRILYQKVLPSVENNRDSESGSSIERPRRIRAPPRVPLADRTRNRLLDLLTAAESLDSAEVSSTPDETESEAVPQTVETSTQRSRANELTLRPWRRLSTRNLPHRWPENDVILDAEEDTTPGEHQHVHEGVDWSQDQLPQIRWDLEYPGLVPAGMPLLCLLYRSKEIKELYNISTNERNHIFLVPVEMAELLCEVVGVPEDKQAMVKRRIRHAMKLREHDAWQSLEEDDRGKNASPALTRLFAQDRTQRPTAYEQDKIVAFASLESFDLTDDEKADIRAHIDMLQIEVL